MNRRRPTLTQPHKFTINCALRRQYTDSMAFLNMIDGSDAGHFLVQASEAWDAYKAFDGAPMHSGVYERKS